MKAALQPWCNRKLEQSPLDRLSVMMRMVEVLKVEAVPLPLLQKWSRA